MIIHLTDTHTHMKCHHANDDHSHNSSICILVEPAEAEGRLMNTPTSDGYFQV